MLTETTQNRGVFYVLDVLYHIPHVCEGTKWIPPLIFMLCVCTQPCIDSPMPMEMVTRYTSQNRIHCPWKPTA